MTRDFTNVKCRKVAAISGASRQAINFWLRATKVDWRRARRVVLQKAWAKASK